MPTGMYGTGIYSEAPPSTHPFWDWLVAPPAGVPADAYAETVAPPVATPVAPAPAPAMPVAEPGGMPEGFVPADAPGLATPDPEGGVTMGGMARPPMGGGGAGAALSDAPPVASEGKLIAPPPSVTEPKSAIDLYSRLDAVERIQNKARRSLIERLEAVDQERPNALASMNPLQRIGYTMSLMAGGDPGGKNLAARQARINQGKQNEIFRILLEDGKKAGLDPTIVVDAEGKATTTLKFANNIPTSETMRIRDAALSGTVGQDSTVRLTGDTMQITTDPVGKNKDQFIINANMQNLKEQKPDMSLAQRMQSTSDMLHQREMEKVNSAALYGSYGSKLATMSADTMKGFRPPAKVTYMRDGDRLVKYSYYVDPSGVTLMSEPTAEVVIDGISTGLATAANADLLRRVDEAGGTLTIDMRIPEMEGHPPTIPPRPDIIKPSPEAPSGEVEAMPALRHISLSPVMDPDIAYME